MFYNWRLPSLMILCFIVNEVNKSINLPSVFGHLYTMVGHLSGSPMKLSSSKIYVFHPSWIRFLQYSPRNLNSVSSKSDLLSFSSYSAQDCILISRNILRMLLEMHLYVVFSINTWEININTSRYNITCITAILFTILSKIIIRHCLGIWVWNVGVIAHRNP